MRWQRLVTIVGVFAVTAALGAQDLAHVGRWKLNPAKSDFGQATLTYEQAPDGTITSRFAGQSYTFKLDGKDYPAVWGMNAAWTSLSPTSWQALWKQNGKVVTTETMTLSSDGKRLTTTIKGVKMNGEPLDDTQVAERISGSSGLTGTWKMPMTESGFPGVLQFSPSTAPDRLVFRADEQMSCDLKLDGGDHPCTHPTLVGLTMAAVKKGPSVLGITLKSGGKIALSVTSTVSADGKTMTDQHVSASGERSTAVYERQ